VNTIPLFPLGTVLFPGGFLPLQIFEVRYLDMIQRCHADGTPFGVVCLTQGQEVQRREQGEGFEREQFHPVGTLAHIEHLEKVQPGLLRIHCRGTQRFEIEASSKLPHGLWMGEARPLADDPEVAVPPDLEPLVALLQDLARQIREQHPDAFRHSLEGPHWAQAGWIANRWCELLPEPLHVKQRLMALDNPLLRLELAGDLVDKLPRG